MKFDKKQPKHWLLLLLQGTYVLLAILTRPFTAKPKNPVVILYGHQFSGNLRALYLQWQKSHSSNISLYFLSLDSTQDDQLAMEGIKVLKCSKLHDMLMLNRATAMITDHGLHMMTPLILLTNIIFIDVWHGIPFKGFVPDDFRLQHRYDEVWVSSPLLKEIYQRKFGFKAEIVYNLGYARADELFLQEPLDTSFRDRVAIPAESQIILYAPTWQQDDKGRNLFPFGENQDSFIQRLSETCNKTGATLVIRSHLNASINAKALDNVRYCSMKEFPDTEDLLQHTDILICDWSSIAFDYIALNRPTIFLDVAPPFRNGFSLDKEYRFGKVVGNMDGLLKSLMIYSENPDNYHAEFSIKQMEVITAIYGSNTDGECAKRQWAHLSQLIRARNA